MKAVLIFVVFCGVAFETATAMKIDGNEYDVLVVGSGRTKEGVENLNISGKDLKAVIGVLSINSVILIEEVETYTVIKLPNMEELKSQSNVKDITIEAQYLA